MSREKITIEDNYDNKQLILGYGDDSESSEFEYITENHTYHDSEKSFSKYDVILKRLSDGKYFKFEKYKGGAGYKKTDFEGVEVKPKTKTITVYE